MPNLSKVNLFIVATPLQYLAAESVALNFGRNSRNCIFYTKPELSSLINNNKWHSVKKALAPKLQSRKKGVVRNLKIIRKNMELISEECEGCKEIRLHCAQIFRPEQNYLINFLRKRHLKAKFSVRIVPDGLLNVRRFPYKKRTILRRYYKNLFGLVFTDFKYYVFKGDRTGTDDKIVDIIYMLPNFPHEYDEQKIVYLPSLVQSRKKVNFLPDVALVIGQPLWGVGVMSRSDVASVGTGIFNLLKKEGFAKILYKSHPVDKNMEFNSDKYEELKLNETLEEHLSYNQYAMIIGVCSSALLTAKTIVPETTRVISYGMNKCHFADDEEKNKILNPFQKMKVELLDG